jgi:hypothetical protein
MRTFLVLVACTSLMAPTLASAGSPPRMYYGSGGHHHHDDNDDALWAIGGVIVGAVVGHMMQRSRTRTQAEPPPPSPAPPPVAAPPSPSAPSTASGHPGPPPGCRDVVVYDSEGNPGVQRQCGDPQWAP